MGHRRARGTLGNVTARKMQEMSFYILCRANDIHLFLYDNTSFSVSFDNGNAGALGKAITVAETVKGTTLRAPRARHSLLLDLCEE